MKLPELPPLPRTFHRTTVFGPGGPTRTPVFTEVDLRSYALQCMEMMREECARTCEALSEEIELVPPDNLFPRGKMQGAWDCAAAIREKTP